MFLKEFSLEGKVAIVTGASRGIGRAIALTLAEAGADVVTAARTEGDLQMVARDIRQMGRRSLIAPTDVTRMEQVANMVEKTIAEFGRIDILVNNAGHDSESPVVVTGKERSGLVPTMKMKYAGDMTEENWRSVIDTHVSGMFRCCKAVAPQMIKQRSGKIINVSSMIGIIDGSNDTHYAASKAAIDQMTRALALELAPYKINVNCIAPGSYLTAIRYLSRPHLAPEQVDLLLQKSLGNIPLGRHGELRELGMLAVYLASPASDYMTGQIAHLDGGWTAK
jgi:NAD(P)-dependent dehydrogenase (short-subunit alcohol dehydrogenase family)